MPSLLYIAGPLFSSHERQRLEEIARNLESHGFTTFLPHRDVGVLKPGTSLDRRSTFRADIRSLDASDGCVALLTGPDHDSGTALELGYMYARGKPCFGITDDHRFLNNMVWGVCDEGKTIFPDIDDLLPSILKAFSNR